LINFNPAATQPGTSNLVFTGFGTGTSGQVSGNVSLPAFSVNAAITGDSVRKLILGGFTYVNIHTNTNAGGEIRGPLLRVP